MDTLRPVVICSDARHLPLADGSVHCVVTSPPYWGLRAYGGDPGMIGLEPTFDEHLANLVEVFREVWRVLSDDGTLFLNYGDAYAAGSARTAAPKERPELVSGSGSGVGCTSWSHRDASSSATAQGSGLKPKDLMMMPARVAMALQADGVADGKAAKVLSRVISDIEDSYDEEPIPDKVQVVLERLWAEYVEARGDSWWLRSEIVWHKPNPMPESITDRPTSSHEKVFLMTKKPRYFYDADAVREAYVQQRASKDGKFVGDMSVGLSGQRKSEIRPHPEKHPSGRNLRNVWRIPTSRYPGAHFATFPPALAKRCILAGTSAAGVCAGCGAPWKRQVERPSPPDSVRTATRDTGENTKHLHTSDKGIEKIYGSGQKRQDWINENPPQTTGWLPSCTCDAERIPATVFDPFGGSGTVGICAEELGRRSALLDINPEYCTMARERIDAQQPSLPLLE